MASAETGGSGPLVVARPRQGVVAPLAGDAVRPDEHAPVDGDAGAGAGAEDHRPDHGRAGAGAVDGLGQGEAVGVVLHAHGAP